MLNDLPNIWMQQRLSACYQEIGPERRDRIYEACNLFWRHLFDPLGFLIPGVLSTGTPKPTGPAPQIASMCYFEGDYRGVEAFSIVEEPIFDSCNLSYFLKTLDQGSIRVSCQHGIAHVQIDVSSNEFHPTGIPPMAPGNGNLTDILPNPRTSS